MSSQVYRVDQKIQFSALGRGFRLLLESRLFVHAEYLLLTCHHQARGGHFPHDGPAGPFRLLFKMPICAVSPL